LDAVGVVLALVITGQAWALVERTPDWRNDRTLAESSVRAHPGNPYALYSLGKQALDDGDLEQADAMLARAAVGDPRSWRTPNAICVLRLRQGRLDEGFAACEGSIARNPNNPRAWVNLASIEVNRRRWAEALAAALRAVELKPHFAEARYLAAVSAANLGRLDLTHEHLRAGLQEEPSHPRLLHLQRQLEGRR
jgi:Flp pilus assembly protein TadD